MSVQLSAEARAARNEYYRKWRAANPDKVRAKNMRYWERKAEKMEAENTSALERVKNER